MTKLTLYDSHIKHGAKMIPFAGYDMPMNFEGGITEHKYIRDGGAGLFDVSHMGILNISGNGVSDFLDTITACKIIDINVGKCKYNFILNNKAGIIDDIILQRTGENSVNIITNASRKNILYDFIANILPVGITAEFIDMGILALQGSKSELVMSELGFDVSHVRFMSFIESEFEGYNIIISRSGYTGEDGFEIFCDNQIISKLYNILLSHKDVKPCGLASRDTLRLEAGLCLYGNELDEKTTPIEAGLGWCINKDKLKSDCQFNGKNILQKQISNDAPKKLVGFLPDSRSIVRSGANIFDINGDKIGSITSGSFSPSLNKPIAIGYINSSVNYNYIYTTLRGKNIPLEVAKLPFIKHNYKKA